MQKCGLVFEINHNLVIQVQNVPIDLLLVRNNDIPMLVSNGLCDAGIVGQNVLFEAALDSLMTNYHSILPVGLGYCCLVIAVPESFHYEDTRSLNGIKIATSHPLLLEDYLTQHHIDANILRLSGSVEIAPRMGMADAICDLVVTGQTLKENQLIGVEKIIESQAVFIRATHGNAMNYLDIFTMLSDRIKEVQNI